jgi:molybdenum cofactor cytidylyltransferase
VTTADRFAGVIPSAGSSLRMGSPKALLQIGGETFLSRTIRALASGGCDPVLVVVPDGNPQLTQRLADTAAQAGGHVLFNADPGDGPITSLRLAIDALGNSVAGLAYLPVDHPMVRPDTVATLLAAARDEEPTALTVPTHRGKRGHPAVFGAGLFSELSDRALEGGARAVVHRHLEHARLVEVEDAGVIIDIDTPEAYAAAVG